MARLIKFLDEYGQDVFISPKDVAMVNPSSSNNGYCTLVLANGLGTYRVGCSAEEAARRINEATDETP